MATGTWGEQSVDTKGNTVVKVYDQAGRLSQVKHASQTTTYTYLDNGALQKVTYPGGAYEEYTYYDDNKLHTLTNKKANGSIIDAYNYAYDGAGNRTQILDGHGTTTYTYDVLNRLLTATEPNGRVTAYTYDGSGNRTIETVTQSGQSTVTTYQYNEQSRLTATEMEQPDDTVRLVDFYYDNNGNMVGRTSALLTDGTSAAVLSLSETEDEAALYDYDVWNNMVSSTVDGETTTHTYNGDGLRVSKTANGLTTRYAYEYTEVVLELDGSGNQKALNVRGHKLLSRVTSAGSSWFMYNGHGDVTALVDGANTVQATYYYDAFGVHKEQTGTADNPYRYSGYTFDEESSLYYLKSRFYDPELARFMQEDTYRGNSADPLSLNLYTYVSNNPIRYWDPTGHVLTETDKANLSLANQTKIENATIAWNTANEDYKKATTQAQKDAATKAMANANAAANAIRASAGYSGGTNGSTVTVSSGSTVKAVVVTGITSLNNKGTVTTVSVTTGAASTITNSGTIGTVNNQGTSIINNTGSIRTVNNSGTIGSINNGGTIGTLNNSGAIGSINNSSIIGIISNSGTIGSVMNSGTVRTTNNSGTIIRINSTNGGTVGIIQNSNMISNIMLSKNTTIRNEGSIKSIVTGIGTTAKVYNTGLINSIAVGGDGILDGDNAGFVEKATCGPRSKATIQWDNSSAETLLLMQNQFILDHLVTTADRNAGVAVSRINGMLYKDFTNPIDKALINAEPEFKKHRLDFGWFKDQVNHGKPWDIKVPESWNKTIADDTFPGRYDTKIVVDGALRTPEELGNMTYGYLGTAAGFRQWVLLAGGDYADGGIWGVITSSDSATDKEFIKLGVQWYKNK
jgi:RHS repeat-associated protein